MVPLTVECPTFLARSRKSRSTFARECISSVTTVKFEDVIPIDLLCQGVSGNIFDFRQLPFVGSNPQR